jgi:hypothetical protein
MESKRNDRITRRQPKHSIREHDHEDGLDEDEISYAYEYEFDDEAVPVGTNVRVVDRESIIITVEPID